MCYIIFLCTVLYTKKWYSTFLEVSVSQCLLWFPEWIFFLTDRGENQNKTSDTCEAGYVTEGYCLALYHIQDHYCTFLQKLVHCQSSNHWLHHFSSIIIFLLLFLSHLQKYCPENWFFLFQFWSNNHWIFFYIYIYKALVITKKKPFSINHFLYSWKILYFWF